MSKVISFVLILFINIIPILYPQVVMAADCPSFPVDISDQTIQLTQNLPPLTTDVPLNERNLYMKVQVTDPSSSYKLIWARGAFNTEVTVSHNLRPDTNNFLKGTDTSANTSPDTRPFINFNIGGPGTIFSTGLHEFDVSKEGSSQLYCHGSYTIARDNSGGIRDCNLEFKPDQLTESPPLITVGGNIQFSPSTGEFFLLIPGITHSPISDTGLQKIDVDSSTGNINPINLDISRPGLYNVTIKSTHPIPGDPGASYIHDTNCQYRLEIAPRGGQGRVSKVGVTGPSGSTPIQVCSQDDPSCTKGGGTPCGSPEPGIKTAVGCVHTQPFNFVKDFSTFVSGIAGGLAFLMMLLGAFQMVTSAGNPDTLHAGRDRFTNGIIGLLIIIFAVLILQILGFDILGIKGFGR